MAKTIGVIIDYLTDDYRRQIDAAAAKHGYAARYFPDSRSAVGNADDCEILFGHCSQKVIASARNLKWFCCCWAGVDRFCKDELYQNPDCLLSNSSGAYGVTIAEHLVMVSLMLLRRQMEYDALMRSRGWDTLAGNIRSLRDCRITVLGTGDIGAEFARRARAFAPAKLIGVRRSAKAGDPAFDETRTTAELDALLPETDLLVMALPNTPETAGILSRARLALLPRGAFVVNVGRGAAVDQDALIDALNGGHLAGAALDVVEPEPLPADHPLRDAKNLLLTPHVAGNTTLPYTQRKTVDMFLEDLENYVSGKPLKHVVDRKRFY
ncbi:MAG: D-2-hydroxyacid dehydrogenase [Oscillospiraceae bacterium]|nr:D-2-hydroxyacid dehydrogenase [Oscillospiraceae bacterium]